MYICQSTSPINNYIFQCETADLLHTNRQLNFRVYRFQRDLSADDRRFFSPVETQYTIQYTGNRGAHFSNINAGVVSLLKCKKINNKSQKEKSEIHPNYQHS